MKQSHTENVTQVKDARQLIQKAEETRKKSSFPNIVFSDNTETIGINQTAQKKTETKRIADPKESKFCQTEIGDISAATQTKLSVEQKSDDEVWVSSVDPTKIIQEETIHNEAPPTMTKNTSLEASHELITKGVVATIERSTMTTENEEDRPLFRKKLQKVLGVRFIAAATKKDRNLRPLINFVKNRD